MSYEQTQKDAFGALVKDGVYTSHFDHAPAMQAFFRRVMKHALAALDTTQPAPVRILDAGCGSGAWLAALAAMSTPDEATLYGFDLTPEMVMAARERLQDHVKGEQLKVGNILLSESYRFDSEKRGFDLIYTYDVIQQLPVKLQFSSVEQLLAQLAPSGVLVIFDNDAESRFGKTMARNKFLTRYLGMKRVPRYYCNARYPRLSQFADQLARKGNEVEIHVSAGGGKRGLVVYPRTTDN